MRIKLFFLFTLLVSIDQVAKNTYTVTLCNNNIAWNIPVPTGIFYFIWILIIITIIYTLLKTKLFYQKAFLVFVFSGAVSNLIDRIRFSCVVDYIDLKFWPVFNLGDVYITVGLILLIINFLRNSNSQISIID